VGKEGRRQEEKNRGRMREEEILFLSSIMFDEPRGKKFIHFVWA